VSGRHEAKAFAAWHVAAADRASATPRLSVRSVWISDVHLGSASCQAGALLDFADVIEGATAAAPYGDCERVRRAAPRPGADMREGEG